MRQKDANTGGGAKKKDPSDKIVRRELQQVFTNGTIVDPGYLQSHEANYCVSIKVCFIEPDASSTSADLIQEYSPGPNMPSSFGICVADASRGTFELSYFDDDIVRTSLETMFRQIRPKELLSAKVNDLTYPLRYSR